MIIAGTGPGYVVAGLLGQGWPWGGAGGGGSRDKAVFSPWPSREDYKALRPSVKHRSLWELCMFASSCATVSHRISIKSCDIAAQNIMCVHVCVCVRALTHTHPIFPVLESN